MPRSSLINHRESDVLAAFLDRRTARVTSLRSDGRRLYAGNDLVAQWNGDQVQVNSQKGAAPAERCKDQLVYHMYWHLQRARPLSRLLHEARCGT